MSGWCLKDRRQQFADATGVPPRQARRANAGKRAEGPLSALTLPDSREECQGATDGGLILALPAKPTANGDNADHKYHPMNRLDRR